MWRDNFVHLPSKSRVSGVSKWGVEVVGLRHGGGVKISAAFGEGVRWGCHNLLPSLG